MIRYHNIFKRQLKPKTGWAFLMSGFIRNRSSVRINSSWRHSIVYCLVIILSRYIYSIIYVNNEVLTTLLSDYDDLQILFSTLEPKIGPPLVNCKLVGLYKRVYVESVAVRPLPYIRWVSRSQDWLLCPVQYVLETDDLSASYQLRIDLIRRHPGRWKQRHWRCWCGGLCRLTAKMLVINSAAAETGVTSSFRFHEFHAVPGCPTSANRMNIFHDPTREMLFSLAKTGQQVPTLSSNLAYLLKDADKHR